MKDTNQNIDKVMDDIQRMIIVQKIGAITADDDKYPQDKEGGDCESCSKKSCGTTININISPVIHTTSDVKESTKNSPLRDLGSILSPLFHILK